MQDYLKCEKCESKDIDINTAAMELGFYHCTCNNCNFEWVE